MLLGFSAVTNQQWKAIARPEPRSGVSAVAGVTGTRQSLMPSHARYSAPIHFIAVNNSAGAASGQNLTLGTHDNAKSSAGIGVRQVPEVDVSIKLTDVLPNQISQVFCEFASHSLACFWRAKLFFGSALKFGNLNAMDVPGIGWASEWPLRIGHAELLGN